MDIKEYDPIWSHEMSLKVNGSGQIIHAYVNGKYIGNKWFNSLTIFNISSFNCEFKWLFILIWLKLGSEWAKYGVSNSVFEQKVQLNPGRNQIALLSVTVGLAVSLIFLFYKFFIWIEVWFLMSLCLI